MVVAGATAIESLKARADVAVTLWPAVHDGPHSRGVFACRRRISGANLGDGVLHPPQPPVSCHTEMSPPQLQITSLVTTGGVQIDVVKGTARVTL